jgi:hypothetical protein
MRSVLCALRSALCEHVGPPVFFLIYFRVMLR